MPQAAIVIPQNPPIIRLHQLYAGKTLHYPEHEPSAIAKSPITDSRMVKALGIDGDEQYEKRFHGGIDRALCHYPREHYDYWKQQYPHLAHLFQSPAFGENISTSGLTEENAFMGDVYQLGDAIIQITQPRSPCYKLNYHLQIPHLSEEMQNNGYCGWLYRVIKEGNIHPESQMTLLSRTGTVSVKEALSIAFTEPFSEERTLILLSSPGLSTSWTRTMQMRLINRVIEPFSYRLFNRAPS